MCQKKFKAQTQTRGLIFRCLKIGAVNPTQKTDACLKGEITPDKENRENSQKKT